MEITTLDADRLNPRVKRIMEIVLDMKRDLPEAGLLAIVNYTLGEVVSGVRGKIRFDNGTEMPLNIFSIVFMNSGLGKDFSLNALDTMYINTFEDTMSEYLEKAKMKYWAMRKLELEDMGVEDVDSMIKEEMKMVTPLSYRISNGTEAGLSKARYTHSLYNAGSVNLVIDEFGANYGSIRPLLSTMLTTYEDGNTNAKQLKESSTMAVKGVPSNFLAYSAPSITFDGGSNEDMLIADLSQGMARRCWYAYETVKPTDDRTPEEIVRDRRSRHEANEASVKKIRKHFGNFIDTVGMFPKVHLPFESEVHNEVYKAQCVKRSLELDNEAERAEMADRASKVLRLAGIYAMIEKKSEISIEHLEQAEYVAEISGEAFKKIVNQPQVYERMFEFMVKREATTVVDLETKKWYRGNQRSKDDLMKLVKAYAYEKNYLLRIKSKEGIDFYSLTPMPKTDPTKEVIVSASTDMAKGFKAFKVGFDELHELVCNPDFYYSAGTFKGGHRTKDNYGQKQNLIILDIDDGMKLETAKVMLSDYKCLIATTRSHQKEKNGITCDRFRVIFLADRTIQLDSNTYSRFMENVFDFIGLPVDEACKDSSRMYYGHKGEYWYSEGTKLIEVEPLIPDSDKEIEVRSHREAVGFESLDNLEKFFINQESNGRNNTLAKYAFVLKDDGYDFETAKERVLELNGKFNKPLSEAEIKRTVFKTLERKYKEG